MRFSLIIITIFHCFQSLFGQTISNISAVNAAQYLVGGGILVSNAQFTGNPEQLSLVESAPSSLGFSNGIVITTNKRGYLQSSELNESAGAYAIDNLTVDPDLVALSGNDDMHSRAYLEFDFISTGSEISFDFVFSSNEYPGYNCCNYNDVFGFFLSGPSVYQNIALVPSTSDPIAINTINNGIPGILCSNPIYCNTVYPAFYNSTAWHYGGSTTVLTATWDIQCQQVYHIKMAICNIGDPYYNSAVFFKGQSLKSEFNLGPVTANVQPICEGQDLTLTTTGSDGYTYTWMDGSGSTIQSSLDLKQITIPASTSNSNYSVSITNPDGCTLTQNINVVVHPLANNPPYVNGINNSGEYNGYVQAGQQICFDIPSFDENPEIVTINWDAGIPESTFSPSGAPFEIGHFCWTPTQDQIGWHYFTVTVTDNNVCNGESSTYTFGVKVICSWELLCIDYEDRTPTNNPLPTYTSMGECIKAGLTATTIVGNSNVTFEAPEIDLGVFFDGNPPFFDAIYNGNTAITDCEVCCDNFNGFTIDTPLPNVLTPNGDGLNDVWSAKDLDNPQCAFNAKGFEFFVIDRWGILVYSQTDNVNLDDNHCCPYRSPDETNAIDNSSIFWDGVANHDVIHTWWQINTQGAEDSYIGDLLDPDYYFYTLKLYGCDHVEEYQGFIYVTSPSGLAQNEDPTKLLNAALKEFYLSNNRISGANIKDVKTSDVDWTITAYPNPTTDEFIVNSSIENCTLNIYNPEGKIIFSKLEMKKFEHINISNFNIGNYRVLITAPSGISKEISIIKN